MPDERIAPTIFDRRDFLAYAAGFAAAASAGSALAPAEAQAQPAGPFAAVDAFILDTVRAVCVMVFPGPDEWSRVQGTPRPGPGPIEVGGGEFMVELFDRYLAAGDQLTRPLASALAAGLNDLGIPAPLLLGVSPEQGRTIDQALGYVYSDRTLPLSVLVALVLTFGALLVAPASLVGPLGSPFARLSLRDKCRVIELVERPLPELVSLIDGGLPGPLRGSGTGFLRFAGGILLEGTAFGVYSELEMFDPVTRTVAGRPPSWELTGYRPDGLVEGHPDLIGYYQGRTEVPAYA
ncbi:hypothetical protein [Nocardia gamkensis]|uniref:Uncharacterized protein n=1 Tax=Nocardia gamkensis TaxID=352869 RepID=A0A7X6R2D2_9NOCA|nr:hypothetical protein [Nocardia gamkensis]NKY26198.1 hypothetical protein [Nocardia gamkensis]NQE69282.1 hypothetical protein [Nocardia gamkensis]